MLDVRMLGCPAHPRFIHIPTSLHPNRAVAGDYIFLNRMSPPEDRSTTRGPPPLRFPFSVDSLCLPRSVTGPLVSISPPLVCASRSMATFEAMVSVMPPPEVLSVESPPGRCARCASIEPPEVDASMEPCASLM